MFRVAHPSNRMQLGWVAGSVNDGSGVITTVTQLPSTESIVMTRSAVTTIHRTPGGAVHSSPSNSNGGIIRFGGHTGLENGAVVTHRNLVRNQSGTVDRNASASSDHVRVVSNHVWVRVDGWKEGVSGGGIFTSQRVNYLSPYGNRSTPVRFTSPYGYRLQGTASNSSAELHDGMDLATGSAVPLYSIADNGVVVFRGHIGGYGNTIIIRYEDPDPDIRSFFASYAHMRNPGLFARGATVNRGDQVGYEGATGGANMAHHLHIGTWRVPYKHDFESVTNREIKPPLGAGFDPLLLYRLETTRASINASGIFITQENLSNYSWTEAFIRHRPNGRDGYHRFADRPLNNRGMINHIARFLDGFR